MIFVCEECKIPTRYHCNICDDCYKESSQETIEHAAVKVSHELNGENIEVILFVPRPGRHHHIFWGMDGQLSKNNNIDRHQGFITSKGRFVDRKEAEKIARTCGQHTNPNIGGPLTSEDLW